jgi:hypothetical protein
MRDVDLRKDKALLRLGNETGGYEQAARRRPPHTRELLLHVAFARLAQRPYLVVARCQSPQTPQR